MLFAQYFTPVWSGNGFESMGIIIQSATLDGVNLAVGDSISVLDVDADDGSYICVGASIVTETITPSTPLIITASHADPDESPQNGFITDNTIKFLFWDNNKTQIISLIEATHVTGFHEVYTPNGTALINPLTGYALNTWNGSDDDDWENTTNWSSGIANDQFSDTKIPATGVTNYPTLTADGECHNLLLKATSAGVGSLMDDDFLTVHGTATVETYLENSASSGDFFIHLIGPTVDEENYTGGGTGAFLSAFNLVDGDTYAYEFDEPSGEWQSMQSETTPILTGKGIALSTTDATDYTLSMTGDLMTGAISSPSLTHSGSNYEMISNPYPSAINFPALATANSTLVENKYWIWNPAGGNYVSRAGTTGATPYIQVGQGFFVETKSTGVFNFTNSERAHSDTTSFLKNGESNVLIVKVVGGDFEFKDEMYIAFSEDATNGYDEKIEAKKWYSMYEDATMIYSIAEDDTELAINMLPIETLGVENVSTPVNFHCGYLSEYTLNFSGLATFSNAEIWLEDKEPNTDWIDINENPVYTFVGSPEENNDRFIIHFYGPTGIGDIETSSAIKIYANGHDIFLANNSGEMINSISIYDISGRLILQENGSGHKLTQLRINEKSGYYIVKVITDKTSYSKKIMISGN